MCSPVSEGWVGLSAALLCEVVRHLEDVKTARLVLILLQMSSNPIVFFFYGVNCFEKPADYCQF